VIKVREQILNITMP